MVNTYNFQLGRGPRNRFKFSSIVFENDVENLVENVLPRVPDTCRYLYLKRPNITEKCPEFKVNINNIKRILKFYIETNRE